MTVINNLAQKEFGRLRALRYHGPSPRGKGATWECVCAPDLGGCGAEVVALAYRLSSGTQVSCGCARGRKPSESKPKRKPKPTRPVADVYDTQKFRRLLVLRPVELGKAPSFTHWLCQCKCGNYTVVRADRLAYNKTGSCGCNGARATERTIKRLEGRLAYQLAQVKTKADETYETYVRGQDVPYFEDWEEAGT